MGDGCSEAVLSQHRLEHPIVLRGRRWKSGAHSVRARHRQSGRCDVVVAMSGIVSKTSRKPVVWGRPAFFRGGIKDAINVIARRWPPCNFRRLCSAGRWCFGHPSPRQQFHETILLVIVDTLYVGEVGLSNGTVSVLKVRSKIGKPGIFRSLVVPPIPQRADSSGQHCRGATQAAPGTNGQNAQTSGSANSRSIRADMRQRSVMRRLSRTGP